MPSWSADIMALACALTWAIAVLLLRQLRTLDAAAVNLFKNTVASLLLIATMMAAGIPLNTDRSLVDWVRLVGSGVLGLAIADTLFLAGLRRIDASVAAVADCAYAPAVMLLAAGILEEKLRAGVWFGALLVVAGLVLVAWQQAGSHHTVDRRGVLLASSGVMMTAVGVVVAKPALDHSNLIEATAIRLISGAVVLFAMQAAAGRTQVALSLFRPQQLWRYAIPATVMGSYVAMILWLGGMKYGSPSRVAILNQMGAIFVLVLSRLAGESAPPQRWIGAGLAVTGVCIVISV